AYDKAKAKWDEAKKAYDEGLKRNENYVESGGYGELSGEVGVDFGGGKGLKVGGSAKASMGTKYSAESLEARKGGAGKDNKLSDSWFTQNVAQKFGRGAEKTIGVTHIATEVKGTLTAGPFSGEVSVAMSWTGAGTHGQKVDDYALDSVGVSVEAGADLPVDKLSKLGNVVLGMVNQASTAIRSTADEATDQGKGKTGGRTLQHTEAAASIFSQINGIPAEDFELDFSLEEEAGVSGSVGMSLGFDFEASFDGGTNTKNEASFELKYNKKVAGNVPGLLKVELTRSSRLLAFEYETGSGWQVG
ncbi:MAG TPA: hypothetical protein VM618_01670, partial [Acidimicrobiia bacterium]|nr:hypothetical protein [Acidimicrobiia bacterium]